jgi:hypothetical protein
VRALRNLAIVVALALVVAFLPGGGRAADAIMAVLYMAFLATIGLVGLQLYRQNRMTINGLSDRDRGILIAAVGAVVLMIAASSEMTATAGRTLIWVGVLALALVAIARIWVEAHSY